MSVSAMVPSSPTDLLSAMGLKVPFPLLPPTQAYKQPPHNACLLSFSSSVGHGGMAAIILLRDRIEKKDRAIKTIPGQIPKREYKTCFSKIMTILLVNHNQRMT